MGTMSHLPWHEFIDTNRRAHLVMAEFDPVETIPKSKPSRFELLRTLVVALAPAGDFALTNVRQDDRASILVGFERQVDAEKLIAAVLARATAPSRGWASQASFLYDRAAYKKIASVLQ
jgi:hypothetical protein